MLISLWPTEDNDDDKLILEHKADNSQLCVHVCVCVFVYGGDRSWLPVRTHSCACTLTLHVRTLLICMCARVCICASLCVSLCVSACDLDCV